MSSLSCVKSSAGSSRTSVVQQFLSTIRISENQPMHLVAIHLTNVQLRHYNPPCLPTLMENMLAAIEEPSILLMHHVKLILLPGSSILLALPVSTENESGEHAH